METTVLNRLAEWWRSNRYSHPVSRIPWSAIRRIGQSRLLAVTIIVPFLGSLLLFNQSVVDILTLSPDLVRRWLHLTEGETVVAAKKLTLSRLYFVYFGLTFLGIGSALFVLFCPLDIKNYSTPIEYQTTEGAHVSKQRMTLILPFVAFQYNRWMGDEVYYGNIGFVRELGKPDDFEVLFSAVISAMYLNIRGEVSEDVRNEMEGDDNGHPYETFRHKPDPSKIARVFHFGRRLEMGFLANLESEAVKDEFRNDVLTLHYMALDHTKPYLRIIIAAFYGVGFGLLLIPTAQTFLTLALNVFHAS